jgi:CheY-like chemotaxis protein/HPt (histidine-containing phosphotransfer) domain-containing protein
MQSGDAPTAVVTAEQRLKDSISIPDRISHPYIRYRVLVVDDQITNCQIAVHMLKKLGHHADSATAGHAAIDMHKRQRYDLILMDCQMPGLDGYQATAQIRSVEAGERRTAIIGWTSGLEEDDWERCIGAGMDDVMAKPIRPETVQQMMARWLHLASSLCVPTADIGGNEFENIQQQFGLNFAQLAALFQRDAQRRIAAMRDAAGEKDICKIATIAHVLGGSSALMGAVRLASMCRDLEIRCMDEVAGNLEVHLHKIEEEYREAEAAIKMMLQSATL